MTQLAGIKIAVLCTDGVEQSELTAPMRALQEAGAEVELVSPKSGRVEAWKHHDAGDSFAVDRTLAEADPDTYQALVLPGGVANPDQLRMDQRAIEFARSFVNEGKPIAAICHGPWLLVEVDGVRGKTITSWPSIKTDLLNAGAIWTDRSVVRDENLVTSRKPDDLPDFNREMISLFAENSRFPIERRGLGVRASVAPGAQI